MVPVTEHPSALQPMIESLADLVVADRDKHRPRVLAP